MSVGEVVIDHVIADFERAFVSLHIADPGPSGAAEASGNLYHRQSPPLWERAGGNGSHTATDVLFDDLPRMRVRAYGFWTEPQGGRFLGGVPVTERDVQTGDSYRIRAGRIAVYAMGVT
jgi:hypothetical protein